MPDIQQPLVSVVMPCLNEEAGVGSCIRKIQDVFAQNSINGEIIVADNGSDDKSIEIAAGLGARVVHQPQRGYGNAYLKGFASAKGTYLVMGDADDTYDFYLIPLFLNKLINEGYDFVTGSRYLDGGSTAIPFTHRYLGNPLLTWILNLLFGTNYTDVYCGYRAFSRKAYDLICPVSPGMEFNLELAINAHIANLRIAEIPIELALRKGESKLNTFSDGWRSLRMMLLYCPNKVFLLPGFFLFALGIVSHTFVLFRPTQLQGTVTGMVIGILATVFAVVGFQVLSLGLHAKTYSWSRRFDINNRSLLKFYELFKLESGLLLGSLMILVGLLMMSIAFINWLHLGFVLPLNPQLMPLAATLIIIGSNVVFSSLFISAMSMIKNESPKEETGS